MEHATGDIELEAVNTELRDPVQLEAYKKPYDGYKVSFFPRILGGMLVTCGNIVYGFKPSYLKFRAVEVIARVPYHSWSSASFTLLTLFYRDEKRAMRFSNKSRYARIAQDNETMHVVVISQLAKQEGRADILRHTIIPMLFAFFYYVVSYVLYLMRPRYSYELNYLFEQHAFDQYDQFLTLKGDELKTKPMNSDFLLWYGRNPISQYDFFLSVRNDELIHRNQSIRGIDIESDAKRVRIFRKILVLAILFVIAFIVLF